MMRPVAPTLPHAVRFRKSRRFMDCRAAPWTWSLADMVGLLPVVDPERDEMTWTQHARRWRSTDADALAGHRDGQRGRRRIPQGPGPGTFATSPSGRTIRTIRTGY